MASLNLVPNSSATASPAAQPLGPKALVTLIGAAGRSGAWLHDSAVTIPSLGVVWGHCCLRDQEKSAELGPGAFSDINSWTASASEGEHLGRDAGGAFSSPLNSFQVAECQEKLRGPED